MNFILINKIIIGTDSDMSNIFFMIMVYFNESLVVICFYILVTRKKNSNHGSTLNGKRIVNKHSESIA